MIVIFSQVTELLWELQVSLVRSFEGIEAGRVREAIATVMRRLQRHFVDAILSSCVVSLGILQLSDEVRIDIHVRVTFQRRGLALNVQERHTA